MCVLTWAFVCFGDAVRSRPLLEVATLLQDKDRWDESLIFIERGAIIADAHHRKEFVHYFEEAKVTLADIQASRKK